MHGRKSKPFTRPDGHPRPISWGKGRGEGQLPAFISVQPDGVLLAIKVQPRASKNEIGEPLGDELRVKVTAPPVDSAANEALLRLLAETMDCSRSKVELLRGSTSPHKIVKIYGPTVQAVLKAIGREVTFRQQ